MSWDSYFKNEDKPYAENLNDALILLDAFDVTVPCKMPDMFSNGQFSSTTEVERKCGVAIVTLKSVASGVTVGTSSISGTGAITFRVYPNFNSFYKWKSIVLDKTGTVAIGFKKADGTTISATVASDGTISEANALKELAPIDVTLTLTSATINSITIGFVNNQTSRARSSANIDASCLINIDGTVAENDEKAVNGGTVYTALDNLSDSIAGDISSLSDTVDGKLDLKESLSNKVTTLDSSTSHYPSCSAVKAVTDGKANTSHTHTASQITGLINAIYPVGSVYMNASSDTNPATLLGVGTWQKIEAKFLFASGEIPIDATTSAGFDRGTTGGEWRHTLTTDEMPSHTHIQNGHSHGISHLFSGGAGGSQTLVTKSDDRKDTYTPSTDSATATNQNTGGGQPHNNMPPYLVVSMWIRTA